VQVGESCEFHRLSLESSGVSTRVETQGWRSIREIDVDLDCHVDLFLPVAYLLVSVLAT
jgi:hypothetical protein